MNNLKATYPISQPINPQAIDILQPHNSNKRRMCCVEGKNTYI